jgi:hypothetical protein
MVDPAARGRGSARRAAVRVVAAAGLVVVAAVLLVWWRSRPGGAPETPAVAPPLAAPAREAPPLDAAELADRIEAELALAEAHYRSALAALEQMAAAGVPGADARVAETLKQSVAVADRAIADGRRALQADPQNVPARESLFEALRRKVALLQDTIALVNEMRKGNQAGAAQIVKGLKSS